jgi:hypothetical protein
MAGKGKAVTGLVKLGVKYGPAAYQAVRLGREPAQDAAKKAFQQLSSRRQALAHASTLLDGSIYKAFADDQQVWVVFSGEQPIATHPNTTVPLPELLAHADLAKRIRPEDVGRRARRARRQGAKESTVAGELVSADPQGASDPEPGIEDD